MTIDIIIGSSTLIALILGLIKISSYFGALTNSLQNHIEVFQSHEKYDVERFRRLEEMIEDNRKYYEAQLGSINGNLRELIGAFSARKRERVQ